VTFFQRIKTPFAESAADEPARTRSHLQLVGEVLRDRREDLGLNIDDIAATLKIKPIFLVALEQGRSHDLPGPAYAIGFVRAYADYLGLDADQVLTRFKAEASGISARPDLALPVPLGERSLPGRALVLIALILTLCGYGMWYYLSTEDRDRPEHVAAVPAALQAPPAVAALMQPPAASSPASTGPSPSAASVPPATAPASGTTSAPSPAGKGNLHTAAFPPPAAASAPSPAQPGSVGAPPAPPPATASGQIAIRAAADCWIQVRAPDQTIVFSRVLKAGETYKVPQRPGLLLRTGNAGALEIAVDGKPAPSIGGIGTLRRDVALDPAALSAGTAVHG